MHQNFYKIINAFKITVLLAYIALTIGVFIRFLSTGYTMLFAVFLFMSILLFFILVNFHLEKFNDPAKWLISFVKWSLVIMVIWYCLKASGGDPITKLLLTFAILIPVLAILIAPDLIRGTAKSIISFIYPETGGKVPKEYSIAKKYAAEHKFKEAIEEYKKFLASNPQDIMARSAIAEIYADKLNEPEQAIEEYRRLLLENPPETLWVYSANRIADIYI
ncbi:MAG: tetratricopeptide repeat protein, partial [Candidatus Omnitrophica bacterium]|nr:tetratricopeptide repeat protein [Candidatus Omnitrophota bacterium]